MIITEYEYVVNKVTLRMQARVHTPGYDTNLWLINPDLPEKDGEIIPEKDWKLENDIILEMTEDEKTSRDEVIEAEITRNNILEELSETDRKMARAGEEIVDNLLNGTDISQEVIDTIARRKELRNLL